MACLAKMGNSTPSTAKPVFVPPFPPGQKITTQLPADVALIRITMTLFFTVGVVAKVGLTAWSWPVVILGAGFAGYTAYKRFLAKDPLVEAFYKIAGSKEKYDKLPVFSLESNANIDKRFSTVVYEKFSTVGWDQLTSPCYQAATQDGRKVLIVKDDTDLQNPALRVLVEKVRDSDISTPAWVESILAALTFRLENQFSIPLARARDDYTVWLSAEISTDLANKLARKNWALLAD